MEAAVFEKFREIIYDKAGISLNPSKEALVSSRIGKRMRVLGLVDHRDYLRCIINDENDVESTHLLDAISTNVTSFFRESSHFDFFKKAYLRWREEGQTRFRFWCAASSTGEEPYTMGMTLLDADSGPGLDVRLLASDISTKVLACCHEGIYPDVSLKSVPPALRNRFFRKHSENGTRSFSVTDELKNLVLFKRMNLSRPPFPMRGPLDAIFCRNVMIYFDNQVRKNLLDDIYRLLRPGGYLFIGHSESLSRVKTKFKMVEPAVYRKD